jgi:putative effector of murein hydrolase LrgA (UPF0299 family)
VETRSVDIELESRPLAHGAPRLAAIAFALGLVGLGGAILLGRRAGWDIFFRSYLMNYAYVLSLALGGLFFVMLQHVVRAGWSVSIRRLAELVAGTLPWLALLFIPLLIPVVTGLQGVYEWANPAAVQADATLQWKSPYLNVPFFIVRCVAYFGLWTLLAWYCLRQSIAQDGSAAAQHTLRLERISAPGLVLFGFSVTFFAVDTLMSLNPHWFSTIWGVYYFSGSVVGFLALFVLLISGVQRAGRLRHAVTKEHYHDLGKLAFGFVVFWAYIAFSQYLLIWYANIPEETVWYRPRQGDTWWIGISLLLLFGHFVAPLLALMSRGAKRRPYLLVAAAVWLLAMHWLDLYYVVAPRPWVTGHATAPLHATDLLLLLGLGGVFLAVLIWPMSRRSLLAQRDPRLAESLSYENV